MLNQCLYIIIYFIIFLIFLDIKFNYIYIYLPNLNLKNGGKNVSYMIYSYLIYVYYKNCVRVPWVNPYSIHLLGYIAILSHIIGIDISLL